MKKLLLWIRAFFGFSRIESNGFLILLPMMMIILFSQPLYKWWKINQTPGISTDEKALDSLLSTLNWDHEKEVEVQTPRTIINYYAFDPNTIGKSEFMNLGLNPYLSQRIINFRSTGFRFNKKEDLLKVYGMDTSWYSNVKPWIAIVKKKKTKAHKPTLKKKKLPPNIPHALDINLVDTTELKKISGVGSVISKRILAFKNKLGGFISITQFEEIYGLDSIVIDRLKRRFFISKDFSPRKININNSALNELYKHPYINFKQSESIINYRFQHGNFSSTNQLSNIVNLQKEEIKKMMPYITVK